MTSPSHGYTLAAPLLIGALGSTSTVLSPPVLAEGEDGAAGLLGGLLPIILIVAIFYFLLIRPQQKRARRHRELMTELDVNDRVVTVGGMHGTIESLDEETLRLEISPGTVITLSRSSVARRLVDADDAEESP